MNAANDIERIKLQEAELVFGGFSEETAFSLGTALRVRAVAEGFPLVIDVRLWDRPLFYCALPGSTPDNPHWVRRKAFLVERYSKSTYRLLLENKGERMLAIDRGLDARDYALHGGGFPIRVQGAGVIGAITVSGLPERRDHAVVVDAICDHLELSKQTYALSEE